MMGSRGGRIRPPRRPIIGRGESGDRFEDSWGLLRDAFTDIHTKNASRLSFEQLYRTAYRIVLASKAKELYQKIKEFEEQWFADHVMPPILGLLSKHLVSLSLLQAPGSSAGERRQMAERFLRGIRDSWEDHNMSMNMIADILIYFDRTYTQEKGLPSTWTATIGLFRDSILRSRLGRDAEDAAQAFTMLDVIVSSILDLVNMERDGDVVDRALIRAITYMLEVLYETDDEKENEKLYLTVFEPRFLAASEVFYRQECERLVREADASTWLRHTQRRLAEERERCNTAISPLTLDRVSGVIDNELVRAHLGEFLSMEGSGLRAMVDNDRVADLSALYQLISRIDPKKTTLQQALHKRVMELGLQIEKALRNTDFSVAAAAAAAGGANGGANGDEAAADEGRDRARPQPLTAAAQQTAAAIRWVDDVLKLKDKFDYFWVHCFGEDLVIQSALARSFSEFINMFNRSSEYVSLFIDDVLKRGIRGKTEAEVDALLAKAIVLLRYVTDRDMFERYYQKHLARRLLQGKSESQEAEKEMISRMKQEMGNTFTSKFEGMFKDMDLSRDLAESYRAHIRNLGDADHEQIDLAISVLTTNNWPADVMGRSALQDGGGARTECIFPPAIDRLQSSFLKYYLKDRSGRVLTWLGTAGTADIRCVFPRVPGRDTGPLSRERRYELSVSTYGMVVLLLFNDLAGGESLSFEEIQAKTNISATELSRTLASISVAPKSRVLLKEPPSKVVRPADRFSFNAGFLSKTVKIKAPTISGVSKVEGEEERRETEKKNDQTRAHIVDAAIVRIMKQRKHLSHPNLVTEVVNQLAGRFKPDISLIKKRIEDLLAREYLDRGEEPGMYIYVA